MTIRIRLRHQGARFIHPMDPMPRTAILAAGFEETELVRVYPRGWNEWAARFQPASVAGPPKRLRELAHIGWRLDRAVIAFTYLDGESLTAADRELFWTAFGVPVFEQLLGPNNELLAMECDAHFGLHVVAGCGNMRLEREKCGCGSPAPRVPRGSRIDELVGLLA